jgi:NADPH:quinone reductase-like Zn-dependent oxidoreductase
MKAIRLHATGQALVAESIATPTPGPQDVLVRVRAVVRPA